MKVRAAAGFVVVLTLAAACSSTAKKTTVRPTARATESASTVGAGPEGPAASPAGASRRRTSKVAGASAAAVAKALTLAPDNKPIKIGVVTEVGNAGAAVGIEFERPQLEPAIRAMADEVNAGGGFAGHPIELYIEEVDQTDQNGSAHARWHNEACVSLTEDKKVFMVLAFSWGTPYAYECYRSHKVPLLNRSEYGDQEDMDRLSPYLMPTMFLNATRMAKLLAISMADQGFLTDKMGLASADEPPWRRSGKVLIDSVHARGGKVIDEQYIGTDLDGITTGIQAAVLRFNRNGVNRVIVWWEGGGMWLLFSQGADAQKYYPRYAISTYDAPKDIQELIPPGQLPGTIGAGFMTARDVSEQSQPPLNEREKACLAMLERRGAKPPGDGGIRPQELDVCELFGMTKSALVPATGKTLVTSEIKGLFETLGSSYPPLQYAGARFAKGRPDGITKYSNFHYVDACNCFRYKTGWTDLPI